MNLLMLILIFLGLLVAGAIFYIAWRLSSERPAVPENKPVEKSDAVEREVANRPPGGSR
jgi:heme/copper-type cytochrome/quinol oxidase subunit 2